MNVRTSALWACLLLASASTAQLLYTVRKGETLGGIAARYGLSSRELLKANPGLKADFVRIGTKVRIPDVRGKAQVRPSTPKTSLPPGAKSVYYVKPGDTDSSVARKHGLTVRQLRLANPGLNWRRLRLRTPLAITSPVIKPAATPSGYAVRAGESDWTIAKKVGLSLAALHKLNPGVKWTRLQIGQRLNVPGGERLAIAQIRTSRAKVVRENVFVRAKPNQASPIMAKVAVGTVARVLDRDGDWYKLKFNSNTGWIRGDLLSATSAASVIALRQAPRAFSATRRLAYHKSSAKPKWVAQRPRVQYEAAVGQPGKSLALIDKAVSYRGVPYRWGGTTSRGFDCSGFTSSVFRSQGVRLPRTSGEQARVGAPVSRGQIKQGDLVFFRTTGGNRISHVGIYVGGGNFIHSSSGGGMVRTDSLSEGYYNRRLATVRRVVSSEALVTSRPRSRSSKRSLVAAKSVSKAAAATSKPEVKQPTGAADKRGVDEVAR